MWEARQRIAAVCEAPAAAATKALEWSDLTRRPKAPSPLRSAGAVHDALLILDDRSTCLAVASERRRKRSVPTRRDFERGEGVECTHAVAAVRGTHGLNFTASCVIRLENRAS